MSNSYYRWSPGDDISLFLQLISPTGLGSAGGSPEVAIRRMRASHGGALDGHYWDGVSAFTNIPTWIVMSEVDAINQPGLYTYLFEQSGIGSEWIYFVYYQNTAAPLGFAVEQHIVTNELFIPVGSPAVPVLPGDTVMGRLAAMEDPNREVAQANADAVWDELANQHLTPGSLGALVNACCAAHSGSHQIEINIQDQVLNPIQGAQIDIYDAGNLAFLTRQWSSIDGKANVALNAGNYSVRIFSSGYSFTVPEPLLVTVDGSVTYQGTSLINITPPSAPDLCVIFGTIRNAAGIPVAGACVKAYAETPQVVGSVQKSEVVAQTSTNANGYFEMELVQGSVVNFAIEGTDVDVTKTVPLQASQDVTTWT